MSIIPIDLRHAARTLKASPGFVVMAVLTLALGLTAVSLIFGVVNTVILRKLSFPNAERIMTLTQTIPGFASGPTVCSLSEFRRWQDSGLFASLTAIGTTTRKLQVNGHAELIDGANVTPDFFKTFGVKPVLGRDFRREDAVPGRDQVVILSDRLWRERFGGDPQIVGKAVRLDGSPVTVIGIAPTHFAFPRLPDVVSAMNWAPEQSDFWMPLTVTPDMLRTGNIDYYVLGRMREGAQHQGLQAECRALAAEALRGMAKFYPTEKAAIEKAAAHLTVQVTPLRESMSSPVRGALWALLGAVGLLLALVLFNLGSLLLTRNTNRLREFALRQTLGASRWQIFQQSLLEQAMIVTAAAGLAFVLTDWATGLLRTLGAGRVPRLYDLRIDYPEMLLLVGLALGIAVIFGAMPLLVTSGLRLHTLLQREGRSTSGDRTTNRLRVVFTTAQIAISMVLLTGAGFLMQSFVKTLAVNPGFDAHHVLTMSVSLNTKSFRSAPQYFAATTRLLEGLRHIPGVDSASVVNGLPMTGEHELHNVQVMGRSPSDARGLQAPEYRVVDAEYFRTLRIPVVRGRTFHHGDAPNVTVINQAMAAALWPGEDPIGEQFQESGKAPYIVIGVIGNVLSGTLEQGPTMQFYSPLTAAPGYPNTFVIRTHGDPSALITQVQNAVWRVDAQDAVVHCRPLEDVVKAAALPRNVGTGLFAGFAAAALILAALGLFGVVSLSVVRRRREFGIRLALGARGFDIAWLELSRALLVLVAGLSAGATPSLFAVRALQPLLFQTNTANPAVYGVAALLLFITILAAAFLPVRRAVRIDPGRTLREE